MGRSFLRIVAAAGLPLLFVPGFASAASSAQPVMLTITATHSVPKASTEFDRVRTFLLAHAGAFNSGSASMLQSGQIGDFALRSVRYHEAPRTPTPRRDDVMPVVPSDERAPADGDTWSASTCSGSLYQRWEWTYGSKGWVQDGYSMDALHDCDGASTGPSG